MKKNGFFTGIFRVYIGDIFFYPGIYREYSKPLQGFPIKQLVQWNSKSVLFVAHLSRPESHRLEKKVWKK